MRKLKTGDKARIRIRYYPRLKRWSWFMGSRIEYGFDYIVSSIRLPFGFRFETLIPDGESQELRAKNAKA